jgi:iron complex outermembrane receptor protein
MDGHRLTPSNANGTVDVDSIPQMLISRVDVVTGGASAVYGSDAVTGVVNFIIDKKFTGLKIDANAGISTYGDGNSYKFGIAGGANVLAIAATSWGRTSAARPTTSPTSTAPTAAASTP